MRNPGKAISLFLTALAALISCHKTIREDESWRSLLSESDRLAAIKEWEPATEYALKALSESGLAVLFGNTVTDSEESVP